MKISRDLQELKPADLLPKADENGAYFDVEQVERLKAFLLLNFSKQLLTEGERYVVTFFNLLSLEHQGQETCFIIFGRLSRIIPLLILIDKT